MGKNVITTKLYKSPCGDLLLGEVLGRLCLCDWLTEPHHGKVMRRMLTDAVIREGDSAVLRAAEKELDEYFAGRRWMFTLPLAIHGTDFQRAVWSNLAHIPYGKTITYAQLAHLCYSDNAVRAVANANGANALSIIIPCHRVVASNGTLGGYGGGTAAKRWLIELESSHFI